MPDINAKIVRHTLPILIVVEKTTDDNCNKMIFRHLESIKSTLINIEEKIDTEIKVGLYTFSCINDFNHPDKLISLSDFVLSSLSNDDSVDLSKLLIQLNKDLSRSTLDSKKIGVRRPCIIFLLDGRKKYLGKDYLTELHRNNFFRCATKIAFLMNNHVDSEDDILFDLVGNINSIVHIDATEEKGNFFENFLTPVSFIYGNGTEKKPIYNYDNLSEDSWN